MIHRHVHCHWSECEHEQTRLIQTDRLLFFVSYFSWISGVVDVQCTFVWAACLRYSMNASLKQRLRTGINTNNATQQSFLLACYSSTSRGQCDFYEVCSTNLNSTSSCIIDYDLWTCSKKIIMPTPSLSHQHDAHASTQLPYDFEFKHVYDGPKMHALLGAHTGNMSISMPHSLVAPTKMAQFPSDISFLSAEIPSDDDEDDAVYQHHHHHDATLSSPNTNGSLFGVPRLPPKQSTHPSPSWDSVSSAPMTTPKWIAPAPTSASPLSVSHQPPPPPPPPRPIRFSSPAPSTIASSTVAMDAQWKEEMLEKMQAYDAHIQSLNTLIAQLLATQKEQQSLLSSSNRESTKCDVAVQSEPPSPCTSDDVGESASMIKSNRTSPPSPRLEQVSHGQQQTPNMPVTMARVSHPISPCINQSRFSSRALVRRLTCRHLSSIPLLHLQWFVNPNLSLITLRFANLRTVTGI